MAWEHTLRDALDVERHIDYIHYNPVKHGYVDRVAVKVVGTSVWVNDLAVDVQSRVSQKGAQPRLLADAGFLEMLEMTSLFFLDDIDRINPEDIKACQRGITIRNEIMHALAKRGRYKFRNRRIEEINTAYSAVMKTYSQFVRLIEKYTPEA